MKKILPFLSVLFFSFTADSQILNIPDANFKTALLNYFPAIDLNADGEIQQTEADQVTFLTLNFKDIADLTGILSFTNLANLTIQGNLYTVADFSGMASLSQLDVSFNANLVSLNVTNCTALTGITGMDCNLSAVNLTGAVNVHSLNFVSNNLTAIDLTGLDLFSLNLEQNNFTGNISITNQAHLYSFYCAQNQITSLSVTNCPLLAVLNCSQNQLTSLTISDLDTLQNLTCSQNQLTTLALNSFTDLKELSCSDNALTSLDVSGCTSLYYVDCPANPALEFLNLKNGPTAITYLGIADCPMLRYICVDDNEITYLQDFLADNFGITGLNFNSYCSFTPGGPYNTITGALRADVNMNGCDAGDPVVSQLNVAINDGAQTGTTQSIGNGTYTFYTNAGNFTITPQSPNSYYSISPASASVNFATAGGNTSNADFCFVPNGNHQDANIILIPVSAVRPGLAAGYKIIYSNSGTTTLSGNLELNFDDTRLNFSDATQTITGQTTGLLSWNYSNLLPLESRSIIVHFDIAPPPVNNAGDSLHFITNINPLTGDESTPDNSFALNQVLTGPVDPNDKTCLEGKYIDITKIGDYVHYLVRFQNIGTDTAFNVVVKDILSDKYDGNSLQLVDASHPCVLKQTDINKLEFIFEGINLPAQSVNDAGSNGFVVFKVKPANTLLFRDSLINNAAIYFDYNLPVITNDAITIIDSFNIVPVKIEYFKGSVVNNKDLLNWKANALSPRVVFDIEKSADGLSFTSIGNLSATNDRCLLPFDFTDENPLSGINYYRLKMTADGGEVSFSQVIALLNKKTGFEIISIAPNPVTNKNAILNITSAQSQQVNISIIDIFGRTVNILAKTISSGSSQIELNVNKLSKGIYHVIIYTSEGDKKTLRFVKE